VVVEVTVLEVRVVVEVRVTEVNIAVDVTVDEASVVVEVCVPVVSLPVMAVVGAIVGVGEAVGVAVGAAVGAKITKLTVGVGVTSLVTQPVQLLDARRSHLSAAVMDPAVGCASYILAASPDTCGQAMDVPVA
jgi:hypothetical protein